MADQGITLGYAEIATVIGFLVLVVGGGLIAAIRWLVAWVRDLLEAHLRECQEDKENLQEQIDALIAGDAQTARSVRATDRHPKRKPVEESDRLKPSALVRRHASSAGTTATLVATLFGVSK